MVKLKSKKQVTRAKTASALDKVVDALAGTSMTDGDSDAAMGSRTGGDSQKKVRRGLAKVKRKVKRRQHKQNAAGVSRKAKRKGVNRKR